MDKNDYFIPKQTIQNLVNVKTAKEIEDGTLLFKKTSEQRVFDWI